jgi:hypothetical protein
MYFTYCTLLLVSTARLGPLKILAGSLKSFFVCAVLSCAVLPALVSCSVNVYCSAEVSYDSYKHDEDKALTPIGTYETDFTKAAPGTETFTNCYGHKAKVVGDVKGEL